ncbi:MAG: type II secretion system protein [Candidatus Gottesmanbacteria bacterium]|nr:type II secretion system protein [Candidatus Gottesmanbacteria bacterium]
MAQKAPNGFTLIELLVSVAIVMLITGGVIVNYNTYNDAQKTRSAVLTVKNNLRLAQSRAYNGDKPGNGCTQLLGYRVSFTSNTYAIQAQCSDGPAGSAQTYTLESGNTFSPVPADMLFRVLTQGADSDVTVTIVGASQTLRFTVMKSGDMSEVTLVQ